MNILITNDDGIDSIGLRTLAEAAKKYGKVYIVAPHTQKSAVSTALTTYGPISLYKNDSFDDIDAYSITGTPADCVSFAKIQLGIKIDIVLSGINNGPNLGTDIIYSGTVGACNSAMIQGYPSIAFSAYVKNIDETKKMLVKVLPELLGNGFAKTNYVLNVNFPKCNNNEVKGLKICNMGNKPHDTRFDFEDGYYYARGKEMYVDNNENSDVYNFMNNYITLTPLTLDHTDYKSTVELRSKL